MGRGRAWWESECVTLCQAWLHVAQEDRYAAVAQKPAFFDRLHTAYTRLSANLEGRAGQGDPRSNIATRAKWKEISRAVVQFDRHLQEVRKEVGKQDGSDDEYTILMKATARQNAPKPSSESGIEPKTSPLKGDGSFEFMASWQFLRKVPLFWEAYSPDTVKEEASGKSPAAVGQVAAITPAKTMQVLVPGGVPDSVAANDPSAGGPSRAVKSVGKANGEPSAITAVEAFADAGLGKGRPLEKSGMDDDVQGALRAAKRARKIVAEDPLASSATVAALERQIDDLAAEVKLRSRLLAEKNALALFSMEGMRHVPGVQEYLEKSARWHISLQERWNTEEPSVENAADKPATVTEEGKATTPSAPATIEVTEADVPGEVAVERFRVAANSIAADPMVVATAPTQMIVSATGAAAEEIPHTTPIAVSSSPTLNAPPALNASPA